MKFKCPDCGHPQYCGCKACLPKLPEGIKPYQYIGDTENISCGGCGTIKSGSKWEELCHQYLQAIKDEFG